MKGKVGFERTKQARDKSSNKCRNVAKGMRNIALWHNKRLLRVLLIFSQNEQVPKGVFYEISPSEKQRRNVLISHL